MHVTNFLTHATSTEVTLSADFIFIRPFEGKRDERFFFAKSHLRKLLTPKEFIKNGFTVTERIWFKVPIELYQQTDNQDAFFTVALPLALVLNENLTFDAPVSAEILAQIQAFKQYYELPKSQSKVKAQTNTVKPEKKLPLAQFFTLGVDSFHTLLCHQPTAIDLPRQLIFVDGYDVPLAQATFLKTIHTHLAEIAQKTHNPSTIIKTNLRELSDKILSWGRFHFAALTAVAMLLPFKKVLINGESFEAADWGLRYGADKLFTTDYLNVEMATHNTTRDVKISQLQHAPLFDLFLKHVRVCWKNIEQKVVPYNCSACQKCLRTQLTFLALGVEKTPTFSPIDPEKIAKIELIAHVQPEWQIVYELLRKKPEVNPKIISALAHVLAKPLRG
jgi:hypothetical protein